MFELKSTCDLSQRNMLYMYKHEVKLAATHKGALSISYWGGEFFVGGGGEG